MRSYVEGLLLSVPTDEGVSMDQIVLFTLNTDARTPT